MTSATIAAPPDVRYGPDGLVPAVVQDVADGRVLMVAWMDAEALAATLETGQVHFHSRSRARLWRKGETSGNVLHLRAIAADCDADALLVTAEAHGPTCHRGTRSCFSEERETERQPSEPGGEERETERQPSEPAGEDFLEELWATIKSRAETRPQGSYTAALLAGGVDAVARKVTEEATEVLIAAKDDASAEAGGLERDSTRAAIAAESADLLYHALVLLAERGVDPTEVISVLRRRHA